MKTQMVDGLSKLIGGGQERTAVQDTPDRLIIDGQIIRTGQKAPVTREPQEEEEEEV